MTVPTFSIYDTTGKWIIEGYGVDPDIAVVDDPAELAQGRDPQLERAIAEVKKALQNTPPAPRKPDLSAALNQGLIFPLGILSAAPTASVESFPWPMNTRRILSSPSSPCSPASPSPLLRRTSRAIRRSTAPASPRWPRPSAPAIFPPRSRPSNKLEKMAPPNAHTVNTRAAVMIEQHQYDEGRRLCQEALKLDPKYYPAKFNLGEIPLMEGKYPEARAIFQTLLNANPRDELVQFRIFLTYLLEKNDAAAREILGKLKFPSDTPAFYYANAAWEFTRGNKRRRQSVGRARELGLRQRQGAELLPSRSSSWAGSNVPLRLRRRSPSRPELTEPTAAKAGEIAKPQIELGVPARHPPAASAPRRRSTIRSRRRSKRAREPSATPL